MAFILRSTSFVRNLVRLSCRKVLTPRREAIFISNTCRVCHFNNFPVRTTVSVAAQEPISPQVIEEALYQLNLDVRNRNILLENVKEIFYDIKERGEITDPQLMLLLKGCTEVSFLSSPKERIEFAEELWKTAENFGKKFNISHYNDLLSVFLENNHNFSPSEFLNIIKEKGLEPNLVTYKKVFKAYCQQGNIDAATHYLENIRKLNCSLNEEDFNALIQCYVTNGDFDKANGILQVMQDKYIDPSAKTYVALLCGYAKFGKIKELQKILAELPDKDVYLSDTDFLEIIFALAIHNHEEHVDMIIDKMPRNYKNSKYIDRVIHRLLHKKKDEVALKLFEKLEVEGQLMDQILSHSKFLLTHFALYRHPDEALRMCMKLEKKGWCQAALGYILRQIFFHKDEQHCLNFLNSMIKENLPIRSHYFWPALIKASKKGNNQMFHVLNVMPQKLKTYCVYTTNKIVFPNYKFSDDWLKDYEILASKALPKKWLSECFLEKLLLEDKFEEVEILVSKFPLDLKRYTYILNILIDYVQHNPNCKERFLNVIYYMAHDYHLLFSASTFKESGLDEDISPKTLFDLLLIVFLKIMSNKDVYRQIMELMLEKKFGITPKIATFIKNSKTLENVDDLLEKLTDPKLSISYDQNLLKLKFLNYKPAGFSKNSINEFPTSESNTGANSGVQKKLYAYTPFEKAAFDVVQLIRERKYQEAIESIQRLPQQKDSHDALANKYAFMEIIYRFVESDQLDLSEKAFHLGVDLGVLKIEDYFGCLRNVYASFNMSLAVDKYCQFLEKHPQVSSGRMGFFIKVIAEGNEKDIRKVCRVMSRTCSENYFLNCLFIGFVDSEKMTEAKKLLDTSRITLMKNFIHNHLKNNRINAKKVERYLKIFKGMEVDRTPIYKILIKKYAEDGNTENVKKLWISMEEDQISDYKFLEKVRILMDDLSVESLRRFDFSETEGSDEPQDILKSAAT